MSTEVLSVAKEISMLLGTSNTAGRVRALVRGLLAAIAIAGVASGCGDASTAESDDAPLAQVTEVSVPDPNGTYFASVSANGSGCPAGTWNTQIAPDGRIFTVRFAAYVVDVRPGSAFTAKDCVLSIKLHTPEGRSFSVQRFTYAGFALLGDGVVGTQTADYWFQGRSVAASDSNRVDLVGPYEDDYLFTDDVPLQDQVWSPCGVERDLNINTRISLKSSANRAGYMTLSSIEGSSGKLEMLIASRRCSTGTPPATADAGSTQTPSDAGPGSGPMKPTNVRLTPSYVPRDQPFTITWTPGSASSTTTYSVELHEHYDFGYLLLWRSPWARGTSVRYDGPVLPKIGPYHVVVVARDGSGTAASDRVLLRVSESTAGLLGVDGPTP